ncbi:hypothetical protein BJ165DRAFT_1588459 [Panaeolus papilionaceus]|nr:hypothetical protein BJ165DRAFT_1588459 [Panaeolus papilionaceus]
MGVEELQASPIPRTHLGFQQEIGRCLMTLPPTLNFYPTLVSSHITPNTSFCLDLRIWVRQNGLSLRICLEWDPPFSGIARGPDDRVTYNTIFNPHLVHTTTSCALRFWRGTCHGRGNFVTPARQICDRTRWYLAQLAAGQEREIPECVEFKYGQTRENQGVMLLEMRVTNGDKGLSPWLDVKMALSALALPVQLTHYGRLLASFYFLDVGNGPQICGRIPRRLILRSEGGLVSREGWFLRKVGFSGIPDGGPCSRVSIDCVMPPLRAVSDIMEWPMAVQLKATFSWIMFS